MERFTPQVRNEMNRYEMRSSCVRALTASTFLSSSLPSLFFPLMRSFSPLSSHPLWHPTSYSDTAGLVDVVVVVVVVGCEAPARG
jgi:hypothetical protein